jgi:hypothetical protein
MFEWLSLYLSREKLKEPWVTRAVESLLDAFDHTQHQPLDCGSLYHAAHGLSLYRQHRFARSQDETESERR